MDRHDLSGAAGGRSGGLGLHLRDRLLLPIPGALYEGWFLPFAVILPVAFALLGGLIALWLRHMPLDVYGQGRSGAADRAGGEECHPDRRVLQGSFWSRGGGTIEAAAEDGARTRYRPVMMTALAFIIGVVPLVIATGAGAGARQSIGTTVSAA